MSAKYQNDEIIIRKAKKEDMVAVAEMIQELADFEEMPDGPKLTVKDLERDCFEVVPPLFKCLVAEERASVRLVGYAVYFPTYSTWEGRATALEDLCVRRAERRRGVGGRLFHAVAKEAAACGSRLDFHVLSWNPAREFYLARGASDLTATERWACFRLAGARLQHYAAADRF